MIPTQPFAIWVDNPQVSEKVQKLLFENGLYWGLGGQSVRHTNPKHLVVRDNRILYANTRSIDDGYDHTVILSKIHRRL
jgi:hypothetical protein